jgi:hypothetical protein
MTPEARNSIIVGSFTSLVESIYAFAMDSPILWAAAMIPWATIGILYAKFGDGSGE